LLNCDFITEAPKVEATCPARPYRAAPGTLKTQQLDASQVPDHEKRGQADIWLPMAARNRALSPSKYGID
jgi:hypothetical protein